MKKYFNNRAAANRAKNERDPQGIKGLHVWRMPKGSRHSGEYAVCSETEYLNTY